MKKQKLIAMFTLTTASAVAIVLLLVGLDGQLPVSQARTDKIAINANVEAIKIASAETARPGDLITYTIVVYNNDPTEAVDVLMVDLIPGHTEYVTHTIANRIETTGTVLLPGTGSLAFADFIYLQATLGSRGTVAPPWVTLATLTVRVDEDLVAGTIVNTAQFWVGDEDEWFVREVKTMVWGKIFPPLAAREH
jgi:uncharacterized repeat protein (TIGR01451 family)